MASDVDEIAGFLGAVLVVGAALGLCWALWRILSTLGPFGLRAWQRVGVVRQARAELAQRRAAWPTDRSGRGAVATVRGFVDAG